MAHKIETMAWAGEKPWHGLGVEVDANLTPLQMQEAAQLTGQLVNVLVIR